MRTADPLLVLALAAGGGALACTVSWPVVVVALSLGWVLRRAVAVPVLLLAVVLMALSAWRAKWALHDYELRRSRAHAEIGAPGRCAGAGIVERSPVVRAGQVSFVAVFGVLDCSSAEVTGPVAVRLYGGPRDLGRGDRVEVVAQLATVRLFRNADLPDPTPGAARRRAVLSGSALAVTRTERGRGLGAAVDRLRAHARDRIDRTFSPKAAPMARALVLGENDLTAHDDEAFRKSGLAHLLAVSGTHLVFAVVSLVRALDFLLVRIERLAARFDVGRCSAMIGAALAIAYADFAGGSGSAWRAAWMLTAAFAARALGRRPSPVRCFAASIAVGAAVDPLSAFDISFLLSAAATAGLIVLGQPLARPLRGWHPVPRFLGTMTIATLSSMIPCAPLLALLAPELTLAGVVANLVAAPVGEVVALPLCLAHSLLGFVPPLERGVALVASGALLFVRDVAHVSANTTWLQLSVPPPGAWHFAVGGVVVIAAWQARFHWRWVVTGALALAAVEWAAVRAGNPRGQLRVTAIDVGQGDSTLVDLPDGRLVLVDGGGFVGVGVDPGRVVVRLLRWRRRRRVDIAVLSHPHPDHFLGLATVLDSEHVGELWDSGQGRAEGAGPVYRSMLENLRRRGVPIHGPKDLCGRSRVAAGAHLRVLGPCPNFVAGANPNDNSLVIHIAYGRRAVLLTGDAEGPQERALIRSHGRSLRADLLKVGHHGSRTSTSAEFLHRVGPRWATVSCGVRNRFGHPHREALAALAAADVRTLRLDRFGSVLWTTDGEQVTVRAFASVDALRGPL